MHDGALATLEDVVDFYDQGGGNVAGQDRLIVPLSLTPEDKAALVAFLVLSTARSSSSTVSQKVLNGAGIGVRDEKSRGPAR